MTATVQVCRRNRPEVIWATVGPVSSGIVARRASRSTGVPYVLDFRDPWGLDYDDTEARRPAWIRRMDRRTLYEVLAESQSIVFQFATMAECYCRAYPGAVDPSRVHIIPNGYEGEIQDSVAPAGAACTVLYAGTLSTYYYYDPLLDALASLKKHSPARAGKLRMLFVGDAMEHFRRDVARRGLDDIVQITGLASHAEIHAAGAGGARAS